MKPSRMATHRRSPRVPRTEPFKHRSPGFQTVRGRNAVPNTPDKELLDWILPSVLRDTKKHAFHRAGERTEYE